MKKSKFMEEQIALVLRLAVSTTGVAEFGRKLGVSEQTPRPCNSRVTKND
jgi:hypothetical protein